MISTGRDDLENIKVFELSSDLLLGSALSGTPSKNRGRQWQPLFSSKDFLRQHKNLTLEEFELEDKSKQEFGKTVSVARQMVLDEAKKAHEKHQTDLATSQQYVSRLEKKLLLRGQNKPEYRLKMSHVDYKEPVAIGMMKKAKSRGPLSVPEKVDVAHRVLVEHELYRDVAREFRVGVVAVHRVIKAV